MPELKNPKHERFAQLIAEGMTQVDAYEEAGYRLRGEMIDEVAKAQTLVFRGQAPRLDRCP